jgi:hypothetical protein
MLSEKIAEIRVDVGSLWVSRVVDEVIVVSSIYRSTKGWETISGSNSFAFQQGRARGT